MLIIIFLLDRILNIFIINKNKVCLMFEWKYVDEWKYFDSFVHFIIWDIILINKKTGIDIYLIINKI